MLVTGVFSVYARLNATTDNTLHSENTPEPMRASVFNLDITFTLTQASPNQCYFVFEGCNDVDSLTLTYKIEYFNGTGAAIGTLDKTVTPLTLPKNANSPSRIAALINFRNTEIVFESGYTYTDIKKIKVTVYIGEDDARLTKTAELSIQS